MMDPAFELIFIGLKFRICRYIIRLVAKQTQKNQHEPQSLESGGEEMVVILLNKTHKREQRLNELGVIWAL